jgi:hypothetical protein
MDSRCRGNLSMFVISRKGNVIEVVFFISNAWVKEKSDGSYAIRMMSGLVKTWLLGGEQSHHSLVYILHPV